MSHLEPELGAPGVDVTSGAEAKVCPVTAVVCATSVEGHCGWIHVLPNLGLTESRKGRTGQPFYARSQRTAGRQGWGPLREMCTAPNLTSTEKSSCSTVLSRVTSRTGMYTGELNNFGPLEHQLELLLNLNTGAHTSVFNALKPISNSYLYFLESVLMEGFLETSRSWALVWSSSQECWVVMADGSFYCTPLPR